VTHFLCLGMVPSQHHRGKSVKKNERIDSRLIKPNEGGPTAKRGNHLRAAISHCCDWCHLPLHPCFLSPPIHLCSASSLAAAAFLLFHFNPLLSLSLTCFSPINPCSVSLTQSIHLSLSLTCFSPINPCSVSLTQSIHLYVLFLPPLPPSWLSFLFYFRFTSLVLLLLFLSLLSSHLLPLLRVSFTSRASCCSGLWSKRLPSKICSFL
jgi:hypothetical protein